MTRQRYLRPGILLLLLVMLLCVLVYVPTFYGGFLFDDFPVIADNPAMRALDGTPYHWLVVALSSNASMLRRPVSMLSLGLDYYLFGAQPYAFKITNLLIHLINGAMFYALALRVVRRLLPEETANTRTVGTISLIGTAFWLLHPLNVSAVAYITQRMNLLATLFTLAGLVCYAEGRLRMLRAEGSGATAAIAGMLLLGALATLSKENGALIVAYALVIEISCFRFDAAAPSERIAIRLFAGLSIALPPSLFAIYLVQHPGWFAATYAGRDFTLVQRLLSEPRILCDYLLWIFVPWPAWMGFFHDDIHRSNSLLDPPSTICAIAFLLALVAIAWKLRWRLPGVAFGIGWFLAGHAMESTVLPLELVFEHRNYLPMAGLLLGSTCTLVQILHGPRRNMRAVAAMAVAALLAMSALTFVRARSWSSPLQLALDDARNHPESARSLYEAGRAIIVAGAQRDARTQAESEGMPYLERAAALDKTGVYPAITLMLIRAAAGPVPQSDISDLANRLRTTRYYTEANAFFYMLNTAAEGKLTLTRPDITLLVEAALANPHFPHTVRATILHDFGRYVFLVAGDKQSAASLLLAATAEDPTNPNLEITLVRFALKIGQPEIARQHLAAAERIDRPGYYAREIAELRGQLATVGNKP